MMPDVHGFEVLKMLKAIDDTRRIPVVLFTSQRLESEGDRERAAAADALLMKSDLSRDTVIDTMHRVCGVTETDHAMKRLRRSSTSTTTRPARYATSRILHRAGFKVLEAGTGGEALQIVREDLPPLVIMDINLPDISGVEVCRRLKADPATASTMVLQMSATNIAVADRVNSLAAGADSFLVEPVEPEELEAVSRALLRLHRSEAALRRALAERELLLKEVNHRVKNSLQLVLSMLSLQGHRFKEPETRELFTKAISRVTAIAAIHERLYQDAGSAHGRDAHVPDRAVRGAGARLGDGGARAGAAADRSRRDAAADGARRRSGAGRERAGDECAQARTAGERSGGHRTCGSCVTAPGKRG